MGCGVVGRMRPSVISRYRRWWFSGKTPSSTPVEPSAKRIGVWWYGNVSKRTSYAPPTQRATGRKTHRLDRTV